MILELLILIAAATIFVIVARRYPETEQEVSQIGGGGGQPKVNLRPGKAKWSIWFGAAIMKLFDLRLIRFPIIHLKSKWTKASTADGFWSEDKKADDKNWLRQADQAFEEKNFELAESHYLKAALKDPKNSKIYSRLGVIYLDRKNYQDARDCFVTALRYEDKVPARHYNLALAYLGLQDTKTAVDSVKKAIKLDPNNEKYRRLLEKITPT
jgi:tetratricopeptide (TPR) repeat protein